MADQPSPCRRFRLLWSLFALALLGLGFLLQEWLSPWPRWQVVALPMQLVDSVLGCPDKSSKAQGGKAGRNYNFSCYYYSKYRLLITTSGNPERIIEIRRIEE